MKFLNMSCPTPFRQNLKSDMRLHSGYLLLTEGVVLGYVYNTLFDVMCMEPLQSMYSNMFCFLFCFVVVVLFCSFLFVCFCFSSYYYFLLLFCFFFNFVIIFFASKHRNKIPKKSL